MIEKAPTTKDMKEKKEFHFSGSGKYHPMTVSAESREAAEKIWIETRQPVEKPKEEKAEDKKQTTN